MYTPWLKIILRKSNHRIPWEGETTWYNQQGCHVHRRLGGGGVPNHIIQ